jgi:hypothetical protein
MAEQVTEKEKPVVSHPQFALWMREFSLGHDDLLQERWKAVFQALAAFKEKS